MITGTLTRGPFDAAVRDGRSRTAESTCSAVVRYVLIASALGLAWGVTEVLSHAADLVRTRLWSPVLWFLALDLSTAYWVILLILIADRMSVTRWPWWSPYVAALLLGGVVGQAAETILFQWLIPVRSLSEAFTPNAWRTRPLIEYFGYLVYCVPAALLYAHLRRMRQQTARLHATQSAQASLRRDLTESCLQSMQTQLEPQALLRTLGRIQLLHAQDPERSLRALDALIFYLRCGIPRRASDATTLRREAAIGRAWLELQRELHGAAPSLQVTVDGTADDAGLPAMILRPLIQYAYEGATARTHLLNLRATIEPPRLRLELRGSFRLGVDAAHGADLERLRERLAMLYQEHAQLTWEARSIDGAQTVSIVADVPYECAHSSYR